MRRAEQHQAEPSTTFFQRLYYHFQIYYPDLIIYPLVLGDFTKCGDPNKTVLVHSMLPFRFSMCQAAKVSTIFISNRCAGSFINTATHLDGLKLPNAY
jgi:hypothetical protein